MPQQARVRLGPHVRRDGCWQRRVLQGKQIGLRKGALLHAALLLLLDLLPVLEGVHLVIVLHPWTPLFHIPDVDLSPQKLQTLCQSHLTSHSARCYASEGNTCCLESSLPQVGVRLMAERRV